MSAADVAARLGVTPSRVRALSRSRGVGQRVGRRVGRDWMFGADDLARLADRRPGRPVGWHKPK